MYVDFIRFEPGGRILTQDDVIPEHVKFENQSEYKNTDTVAKKLKDSFDFIWREFGFNRSINYNKSGNWASGR
ncbi:unnamed protein product [marine sediment metagenome]|uniref:Uncharacterized protein n=1 Tax=marine sediment metagenome TaxID=412755 RepID=X0Z619_9ZZZZ